MNKGVFPSKAIVPAHTTFWCALLGGGGATNLSLPANGQLSDATATYPKAANFATSGTYVSTGLYTIVYSETFKHVVFADGSVVSAGGAPTAALECIVTKITPGTNTITVKIVAPNGTLTDMGTSDLLILRCDAADTGAIG